MGTTLTEIIELDPALAAIELYVFFELFSLVEIPFLPSFLFLVAACADPCHLRSAHLEGKLALALVGRRQADICCLFLTLLQSQNGNPVHPDQIPITSTILMKNVYSSQHIT